MLNKPTKENAVYPTLWRVKSLYCHEDYVCLRMRDIELYYKRCNDRNQKKILILDHWKICSVSTAYRDS